MRRGIAGEKKAIRLGLECVEGQVSVKKCKDLHAVIILRVLQHVEREGKVRSTRHRYEVEVVQGSIVVFIY